MGAGQPGVRVDGVAGLSTVCPRGAATCQGIWGGGGWHGVIVWPGMSACVRWVGRGVLTLMSGGSGPCGKLCWSSLGGVEQAAVQPLLVFRMCRRRWCCIDVLGGHRLRRRTGHMSVTCHRRRGVVAWRHRSAKACPGCHIHAVHLVGQSNGHRRRLEEGLQHPPADCCDS